MPAIVEGQDFASLQAFKNALHDWAIEKGFTAAILDSDCHRVRAGCRSSPGCPFRIRANYNERRGHAKVTTVEDVHTCTSTTGPLTKQDIKRAETSKLKFLVEAVPKHMTVDHRTPTTAIIDIVKEKYGQNIALRQAQKVKAILCPKSKRSCGHCGRNHASTVPCPQPRPRNQPPTTQGTSQTSVAEDTSGFDFTFTEEQPQQLYNFTVTSNPPQISGPTLLSIPGPTVVSNLVPQALPLPPSSLPPSTRETIIRSQAATTRIDPRLATENRPHSTGPISHPVPSQPRNNNPSHHPTSNPPQTLPTAPTNTASQIPVTHSSHIPTSTPSHLPTTQPSHTSTTAPPPSAPATRPAAPPPSAPATRPAAPAQQTTRTPQETRLEAARLMQNAARLMQEAARMNAEAARLTASVANF